MKHYTSERCDPPSAHSTTPPIKTYKPSSAPSVFVYDQQIIELKITMDSREKESDFYFAKLKILKSCANILISQTYY
ncbi:unnamed protein product [Lactuca virosa]|uniref:Uncharacterized protein n=1 Tax=Lactuca virosa TaxID=75947 RepID=A0AAU9LV34_9ASTR|nr:unnamed protein product [Lactuca virosa]